MGVSTRRRVLATLAGAALSPLGLSRALAAPGLGEAPTLDPLLKPKTFEPTLRRRVLYVVIDRVEDGPMSYHQSNIHGVRTAVSAFDPTFEVVALTVTDLAGMDAALLDATYQPLAVFGAGSFTEWFMYAVDSSWRSRLDHYMGLLRTMKIPLVAVCGSHQLVAIAFNGFSAVAHMTDHGAPVRVSEELAAPKPRGMWPWPRVGEEGNYPVLATQAGLLDPIVKASGTAPIAASHHKDMVVDTSGFTLLYQGDESRTPATTAGEQVKVRCRVQGMRLDDPTRLLYSTQFHPEMRGFDESTTDDKGFGVKWLHAFLREAQAFWAAKKPA